VNVVAGFYEGLSKAGGASAAERLSILQHVVNHIIIQ